MGSEAGLPPERPGHLLRLRQLRPPSRRPDQRLPGREPTSRPIPAIKVVIGGYCDERGSAEYNLALGENRANAARTALVNAGISSSRLRIVAFGKEKQFCTEQDETCYQQNRRAQFSLDR